MTTGAFLFMAGSWAVVLGLAGWSYRQILKEKTENRGIDTGIQDD